MKHFLTLVLFIAFASNLVAQKRSSTDTFIYSERGPSFYYDSIQPAIREFGQREEPAKQYSSMDFTGLEFPTDPENYTSLWHNKPLSQGATGTCWCFAGTSFIESEVYRITGQKVKLSEMHTVYWEYVERAKYFVKNRGNMNLGQGSESNAVTRIMKNYGAMPLSAYSGKLQGQKYHDHGLL
ncbi:MAG: hypothetical protein KDD48_05255, partial [Bdellovibrionales bacterium]|nr:hypothetical protein [Bdellovibrionales bacterium]